MSPSPSIKGPPNGVYAHAWGVLLSALRQAIIVGFAIQLVTPNNLVAAKVGVVTSNPDVGALADVLSVSLSRLTDLIILERAEIQRVLREQEIALTQPQAIVKAGRLLNAEGLVLLEKRSSQDKKELLSVRTIAVNAGVIILQDEFVLPVSDPTTWATSYLARIEKVVPKLNVKLEDAVPISIGSLRASVSTGEGLALEQEMTALLRLRLAKETDVFVTERREMESLQLEKDFAAIEDAFWSGAYVIDGTINRDIVSSRALTVDLRVTPPRMAPIQLRVEGRPEQLASFINSVVTNILQIIGKKRSQTPWQTQAEAEAFLQEAQWAATWGLWAQAREAADATWFLGNRTALVAAYRIVSRGSLAMKMRGYEGHGHDTTDKYGFYEVPSPEVLPATAQTIELFHECTRELSEGTNVLDAGWVNFALHLLPVTARILEPFYKNVDYRAGREADLLRVRALAREMNSWLMTNKVSSAIAQPSKFSPQRPAVMGLPHISYYVNRFTASSLAAAWWESEGLWFDSPNQAIAVYESLLSPKSYFPSRNTVMSPGPPLVGWTLKDRRELPSVWLQFLTKLTASSNALMRADGFQLILSYSNDPDEIMRAAQNFKAAYSANPDPVEDAINNRIALGVLPSPASQILSGAVVRIERWSVPQEGILRQLRDTAPKQLNRFTPEYAYATWKNILRKLADTNETLNYVSWPSAKLNQEQLSELIPAFERAKQSPESRKSYIPSQALLMLRSQQDALAKPQVVDTSAPLIGQPPPANLSARVVISRVWREAEQSLPTGRTFPYGWPLKSMFWEDDRLWMIAQTYENQQSGNHPKLALLKFNVATMQADVIESPFEEHVGAGPKIAVAANGEVFLAGSGAVWWRNANAQWKKLPVPVSGLPVLWRNSIVLSASDTITQLELDSGEVRILASARRNPPSSALDRLNLYGAVLKVWPDDNLYASVAGKIWRFDPKQNDWREFLAATNCGESFQLEEQGVFFRRSHECGGAKLFGAWRPGVAAIDYYTWTPSSGGAQRIQESFTPPFWKVPEQSVSYNRRAQFDGSGIWLFPVLFNHELRVPSPELSPPTLLFLDPTLDGALEIEIDFATGLKEEAEAYRKSWPPPAFLATPEGLAIQIAEPSRLLWIKRTEIEAALTRARQQQRVRERVDAPGLNRFDKNRDGWLDDTERRAMRHDTAWQRELSARIESACTEAVKQHGTEWQKLFAAADKDRDSKLSIFELSSLITQQPAVMNERLVGSSLQSLAPLTRPYDLNSDGTLNAAEFTSFMADPRLPSEVSRSPMWVTNFGLKPEQCDTNDDGILDSAERTAALRLIRQKSGAKTADRN
jgi:hypothetical protein